MGLNCTAVIVSEVSSYKGEKKECEDVAEHNILSNLLQRVFSKIGEFLCITKVMP